MPLRNEEYMLGLIQTWAKARCEDFGECETQQLYDSFRRWVVETRAMRHLPGQVAFGMAMRAAGYTKARKIERRTGAMVTFWLGIALRPAVKRELEI